MKKLILTSLAAAALTLTGCDSKPVSPLWQRSAHI